MNGSSPQFAPTVIRAATMIDGRGGEPLTNQAIVIDDGLIRHIKPWGDESIVSFQEDAEVIDVEGATFLPGLTARRFSGDTLSSTVHYRAYAQDKLVGGAAKARRGLCAAGRAGVCSCRVRPPRPDGERGAPNLHAPSS